MHGLSEWFGWLLAALYYAPYIAGAMVVAGVVFVAVRIRGKK